MNKRMKVDLLLFIVERMYLKFKKNNNNIMQDQMYLIKSSNSKTIWT